mgnify:CR=1 FL=1
MKLLFFLIIPIIITYLSVEHFETKSNNPTTTPSIEKSIDKMNDIEYQDMYQKTEFFNELSLRILEEDYKKDNLNKLKINERLNVLDKLAKINYYLPLDIFKDKSNKDVNNLIDNKKMSLEQSNEIIKYYLRGLDNNQQKKLLEILKKQFIYIFIIYFNNLSYINCIKYLRKLLNPEYKYPINVFNENKIYSKLIFSKTSDPELNKYFRPIDTIERPIDNTKFNIIPNTKPKKINKKTKIDTDIEYVNKMLDKPTEIKLSKEDLLKLDIDKLNTNIINKLKTRLPDNKINYNNIYNKIVNENNYEVDDYIIQNIKSEIENRTELLKLKNNYNI